MAEILKVTTPLIPKENLGSRNKPVTDQAFDLTDPGKVHKPGEGGRVQDQQGEGSAALRDMAGRETLAPILRSSNEILQIFQKITVMLQMGISTSDVIASPEIRELIDSLFLSPEQLMQAVQEQDAAAVMFKGAAFNLLREILIKFPDQPKVRHAVSQLLKAFENNVNAENSVKTILNTCRNLLDYMFSGDREQFSQYLQGLSELLLSKQKEEPPAQAPQPDSTAREEGGAERQPAPEKMAGEASPAALGVEHREAAQILKGNLLPLLGEIVVKYNQNERIRDMVMVVVHNTVRVDQGTPESLMESISKLVAELRLVANLPEGFEEYLTNAVLDAKDQVKSAQDQTMSKLASLISETLTSSQTTNPAVLRQTENLLLSLLQNQNSVMDILHFMLPLETQYGKMFAEMYVDPDSDEKVGRSQDRSRKIFLSFESENLGAFEMCFLETAERVDFFMWCPEILVSGLSSLKRSISDIMQVHGYTMNSYQVAELAAPHSIADVFPRLLNKRMGVDVRI